MIKLYTTVGIIEFATWRDTSKYVLHREDGPAWIEYNNNGIILSEIWYINGVRHREDGPAYIIYNKDGSIWYEHWSWCGMLHRHDYTQPSFIYKNGARHYYWYGVQCKPKDLLDKNFRDRIALQVLG